MNFNFLRKNNIEGLNFKIFTEKEIQSIYDQHVKKDQEYFFKANKRYESLSNNEKKKWFESDFPRLAAIFDFEDWIEKYQLKTVNKLLATAEYDPELEYIQANRVIICDYEKNKKKYDLHSLNLREKDFDLAIINQTLEHIYNPFLGMKNIFNHLKPGGNFYTTVPTINIPHMIPFHFWGITPIGLCLLCKSVGFEILECGYWGNNEYIKYIFDNNDWPTTDDVKNKKGFIENNLVCQAQTWILVKRPF